MKVTIPFSVFFFPLSAKSFWTSSPLWCFPERQPHREWLLWPRVSEHADELGTYTSNCVFFVFCLKRGHAGLSRNRHANGSDTSAKRFKVSKVTAWWQHAASEATRWTRVSHFSGNQSLIFSSLQLRAQWCSIVFTGLEQCIIQEYF